MKREATKKKASTPKEDSRGLKRLNFLRKSKWVTGLSPESFGVIALLLLFIALGMKEKKTFIHSFMLCSTA